MFSKNIFLLLSFFLLSLAYGHVENHLLFETKWNYLATISTHSFQETFKELSHEDIDIAGVDIDQKLIDVLISDKEYRRLVGLGYDVDLIQVKGISSGPDGEYKNPEEVALLIEKFTDRFPEITKRVNIGRSVEGRDIWAIKISDNPDVHEVHEPAILFNSMHHAREVMTPEVSLDIIEYLLTHYISDTQVTKWINSYEIWVVPMLNVDGNNKMWNRDKWWRKNNRGGYGVDLNRNYPTGWNKCRGSSGRRSSDTYRGPNPGSEPETQAIMNLVAKVRPVFDISYHSYSELVIYPLGCSPERTKNKGVVEKIGKEIAQKLNYRPGTAWELLYNADGGDIDWMYEAYQVIPYVIELNSRRQGFHPRYDLWRDKTVKRNRVGWKYLLERLEQSGVRGQLTQNGLVMSDFYIEITDLKTKTKLQEYLGHKSGFYHLVLNPGKYELKFKDQKHILKKEIVTIRSELMELNIEL